MKIYNYITLFILAMAFASCQKAGKNSTGSEYMPDMGHSIAYEANVTGYYDLNRWGGAQQYYDFSQPRKPVANTIARGYAGNAVTDGSISADAVAYKANGSVPYYYGDTDEERLRATAEIIKNPYPITEKGLSRGKDLYNIYCGICHGDKGDGSGFLVRDDGKYPAQPADFTKEEFMLASNGRFYHSIMYGKNVMGSYADKLSFEERWQVIHYIRALQAAKSSKKYTELENTLNTIDVPYATVKKSEVKVEVAPKQEVVPQSEEQHSNDIKEKH